MSEQADNKPQDRPPHVLALLEQAHSDRGDYSFHPDLLASFVRATELASATFDRLTRYEYLLWRQAHQLTLALDTLCRRGEQRRRWRYPRSSKLGGITQNGETM